MEKMDKKFMMPPAGDTGNKTSYINTLPSFYIEMMIQNHFYNSNRENDIPAVDTVCLAGLGSTTLKDDFGTIVLRQKKYTVLLLCLKHLIQHLHLHATAEEPKTSLFITQFPVTEGSVGDPFTFKTTLQSDRNNDLI